MADAASSLADAALPLSELLSDVDCAAETVVDCMAESDAAIRADSDAVSSKDSDVSPPVSEEML